MKQYTFKLKKGEDNRIRVITARTYLQAVLVLQPLILDGFIIEEYKEEPIITIFDFMELLNRIK